MRKIEDTVEFNDNTYLCAVTSDLLYSVIDYLSSKNSKIRSLPTYEKINVALFSLGFNIHNNVVHGSSQDLKNKYVRSHKLPYMVRKAKDIYAGTVRNTVKSVVLGKVSYTDDKHPLVKEYEKYGVLDLNNIPEDEYENIGGIGTLGSYNR